MKIAHKMNPVLAIHKVNRKSNKKNLHIGNQGSHDGEIKVNHSIEEGQILDICDDGIMNIEVQSSEENVGSKNRIIQLSITPNPVAAHANMYEQISQQLLRVDMNSKTNEQDNKLNDMHFKPGNEVMPHTARQNEYAELIIRNKPYFLFHSLT